MLTPVPPNERQPLCSLFDGVLGLQGLIDSVMEGILGDAYADDPANPRVGHIRLDFNAIAGDPEAPAARDLLAGLEEGEHVAVADAWTDLLVEVRGHDLQPYDRFDFSPGAWDRSALAAFHSSLTEGLTVTRVTGDTLPAFEDLEDSLIYNFESGEDFLNRGIGFGVFSSGRRCVAGCSSFAISSRSLEFEIQTDPAFQRRGLALATGARMIEHCIDNGLRPCWDAGHEGSARLAERLGFTNRRQYTAYRVGTKPR